MLRIGNYTIEPWHASIHFVIGDNDRVHGIDEALNLITYLKQRRDHCWIGRNAFDFSNVTAEEVAAAEEMILNVIATRAHQQIVYAMRTMNEEQINTMKEILFEEVFGGEILVELEEPEPPTLLAKLSFR